MTTYSDFTRKGLDIVEESLRLIAMPLMLDHFSGVIPRDMYNHSGDKLELIKMLQFVSGLRNSASEAFVNRNVYRLAHAVRDARNEVSHGDGDSYIAAEHALLGMVRFLSALADSRAASAVENVLSDLRSQGAEASTDSFKENSGRSQEATVSIGSGTPQSTQSMVSDSPPHDREVPAESDVAHQFAISSLATELGVAPGNIYCRLNEVSIKHDFITVTLNADDLQRLRMYFLDLRGSMLLVLPSELTPENLQLWMGVSVTDVMKALMLKLRVMATLDTNLKSDVAERLVSEFGFRAVKSLSFAKKLTRYSPQ